MADPRDIGRLAMNHVPIQDGVRFDVDGTRHTVNSANNPAYPGLAYHSQEYLATGVHHTNIIGPDGTVVG